MRSTKQSEAVNDIDDVMAMGKSIRSLDKHTTFGGFSQVMGSVKNQRLTIDRLPMLRAKPLAVQITDLQPAFNDVSSLMGRQKSYKDARRSSLSHIPSKAARDSDMGMYNSPSNASLRRASLENVNRAGITPVSAALSNAASALSTHHRKIIEIHSQMERRADMDRRKAWPSEQQSPTVEPANGDRLTPRHTSPTVEH